QGLQHAGIAVLMRHVHHLKENDRYGRRPRTALAARRACICTMERTWCCFPLCCSAATSRMSTRDATFSYDAASSIPFCTVKTPPLLSQEKIGRSTTGWRNSSIRSSTNDGRSEEHTSELQSLTN